MGVVIQQASKLQANSQLVIGIEKSGKSVFVRKMLEDAGAKKPLYIYPASADKSAIAGQADVAYVQINSSKELREFIPNIVGYDAVVLDGLYDYSMIVMDGVVGAKNPELRDWNTMSRQLAGDLVSLRDASPLFVSTLLINLKEVKGQNGAPDTVKPELALNAKAYQLAIPLFARVAYTYARVGDNDNIDYQVQTETGLAIRLVQLPE